MTMQLSASDKDNTEILEDFGEKLKVHVSDEKQAVKQEEGENEEEFSFACTNPDGSAVSADDIFQNGKIRPIFPLFDQSLLYRDGDGDADGNLKNDLQSTLRPPLKKLFTEDRSDFETVDVTAEEEPAGPFCEWSSGNKTVEETSSETCKKSNSTGFSKLWRFRDLVLRSNSDGKDAFVFLNNNHHHHNKFDSEKPETNGERPKKSSEKPEKTSTSGKTTTATTLKSSKGSEKGANGVKVMRDNKNVKVETVSSMYEKHYLRNRVMREGDKHKPYSPYRQDLVGFFTNVNGLSRNVHPF